MASFEKLSQMKPGDVFYECEYGANLRAQVVTAPVASSDEINGKVHRILTWEAVNTESGTPISYRWTEFLDHYGPRIYDEPQYGYIRDGQWETPLVGAAHD